MSKILATIVLDNPHKLTKAQKKKIAAWLHRNADDVTTVDFDGLEVKSLEIHLTKAGK